MSPRYFLPRTDGADWSRTINEEAKRPSSAASADADRLQLLIDSVVDYAIYMLDLQGRVKSWNVGAVRLKGYSVDEILGQHFRRFYTPEDQAAGVPALALKTARVGDRRHP
jgi:PAS domain S-box-containing protein